MQSEQGRQRRRERKRLKREEKRRNFRPSAASTKFLLHALPPMGDVLLEYGQPLVKGLLPTHYGPEELRAVLKLASLFWNGIFDDEDVEEEVPPLARMLVAKLQMPLRNAFAWSETLAYRRVESFGDDPRTVTSIEVSRDGDRLRVTARSTVLPEDATRLRAVRARVGQAGSAAGLGRSGMGLPW
jgi:hypothetical protein